MLNGLGVAERQATFHLTPWRPHLEIAARFITDLISAVVQPSWNVITTRFTLHSEYMFHCEHDNDQVVVIPGTNEKTTGRRLRSSLTTMSIALLYSSAVQLLDPMGNMNMEQAL